MAETRRIEASVVDVINLISKMDSDIPVMMWGEPGAGKTKTLIHVFEGLKHIIVPVLAGQSEPTDIGGIPFPGKEATEDEKKTDKAYAEFLKRQPTHSEYLVPRWGFMASDHEMVPKHLRGPMVLFFDDIVTAHEQTQAAFYKVVDEKRIGNLQMRKNVRIIAAGNRLDDMSAVTDMPKALCNRFMHFYVTPNCEDWLEWAVGAGIHPHVVFFVRQHQNRLSEFESAKEATDIHAWATPRTWEMLSKALFSLEEAGLRDNRQHETLVVQGCIGALATTFTAQIRQHYQIVPAEDIVKDPMKAEIPTDIDRLYATVTNLEHWFLNAKNRKHYKAYAKYTMRLPDDFSYLCARQYFRLLGKGIEGLEEETLYAEILEATETNKLLEKWGKKDISI